MSNWEKASGGSALNYAENGALQHSHLQKSEGGTKRAAGNPTAVIKEKAHVAVEMNPTRTKKSEVEQSKTKQNAKASKVPAKSEPATSSQMGMGPVTSK